MTKRKWSFGDFGSFQKWSLARGQAGRNCIPHYTSSICYASKTQCQHHRDISNVQFRMFCCCHTVHWENAVTSSHHPRVRCHKAIMTIKKSFVKNTNLTIWKKCLNRRAPARQNGWALNRREFPIGISVNILLEQFISFWGFSFWELFFLVNKGKLSIFKFVLLVNTSLDYTISGKLWRAFL